MTVLYLSIELFFDCLAACLGTTCIVRSAGNLPRRWWGIITVLVAVSFVWENVGWLHTVSSYPEYRFEQLLDLEKMTEFYAVATVIGFFPIASMLPGYLKVGRTLFYLVPSIVVITAAASYLAFNGHTTTLRTLGDVAAHANSADVKLRLNVFACSVAFPMFCFFLPLIKERFHGTSGTRRASGPLMRCFIASVLSLLIIYVCFTLCINYVVFNLFGAASIAFVSFFALLYLLYESPFTVPATTAEGGTVSLSPLLERMESNILATESYAEAELSLADVASAMAVGESEALQAIKASGYSGFREYIVLLRLRLFREKAVAEPHKSVKELMYACGFTSRSAFYRAFANYYETTPKDFIHAIREKAVAERP